METHRNCTRSLSNLILNAADAIPDGGQITVVVEEVEHDARLPPVEPGRGRWVHLAVRDTGRGIAPAALDRIFEPLFCDQTARNGARARRRASDRESSRWSDVC